MTGHLKRILLAIVIFLAAALIYRLYRDTQPGYSVFDLLQGKSAGSQSYTPAKNSVLAPQDVPVLARFNEESTKVVAAVLPSVVSVNTTGKRVEVIFRDVFGRPLVGRQVDDPRLGSGVIVSKEGHVVTNYHVVQNSQKIQITTGDHQTFNAELVGTDSNTDIAVLHILSARKDFPALHFANSDEVKVGQLVFAVGNPFGLSGTVTQGIISATQRHFSDSGNDLLQTDTVINPGNSGGPLVNISGEIVGINVAIYRGETRINVWQGVGLAIPSNDVSNAFTAIMNHGSSAPVNGYLGLTVLPDPVSVDSSLGGTRRGAMVAEVAPGSPAANSGLQEGDVIVKFGDRNFNGPNELMQLVNSAQPGQTIPIVVVRNSRLLVVNATVQRMPPRQQQEPGK